MVMIEINISKEIEKAIEKEVEKKLDEIGILSFVRGCVRSEFNSQGLVIQVRRHEALLKDEKKKR